mgnify:FL=1
MSKVNDFFLQFGADKFMHFMAGSASFAITESWLVLAFLAFGKELYDYIDHKARPNKDVIATLLGGIFSFISMYIWNLLPFRVF